MTNLLWSWAETIFTWVQPTDQTPTYFEAEQRLFLPGSSPLTTWPTYFWSWAETIITWIQPTDHMTNLLLKLSRLLLPGSSPGGWSALQLLWANNNWPHDQLLKLSRDYFYLGPAQVTDQLGSFCETTLTGPMTNLLWSWAETIFPWVQPRWLTSLLWSWTETIFYLGPAQVTDQPTFKLSRDYFFYLGPAQVTDQ